MTTPPVAVFRHRLALRGEDWLALGMLALLFVFALAGAFTHMHDWTITAINEALRKSAEARGVSPIPVTPDWFGWSNAVTSEIMPTYALLTVRKRQRQGRSVNGPGVLFVASSALSLLAQLSATGVRLPYDAQLLVCLPAIALMVLGAFKFSDMSYARSAAVEAEQAAEHARRRAEVAAERAAELERQRAEQAAEQAAELERQAAEREAELAREAAEREAERAERLARIEAEQATERARMEMAERAEVRRTEQERQRRADEAEAARLADAARIEAEARAERERAQAALIKAEADRAAQAAALLKAQTADHGRARHAAPEGAAVTQIRQRRTRDETAAHVDAVLSALPHTMTRDEAVKRVAAAIGNTERYAREFVPAGWPASSSAGGEESAA
jgi:hypothetical protein